MAYPPESLIRLPLLQFASDGKVHSVDEAEEHLAKNIFQLPPEIRNQVKSSGNERLFLHKVRWSRTDLRVAGLIQDTEIAHFQITQRGLDVLKNPPPVLNDKFLNQFEEFAKWRRNKSAKNTVQYFSTKSTSKSTNLQKKEREYHRIEKTATKKLEGISGEELNELLEKYTKTYSEVRNEKTRTSKSKTFERDPKLAALMKKKHNFTCQICEKPTFEDKNGGYYVESHHIIPRSKKGPDSPQNILIVCANCHKIFDKGNDGAQIDAYLKIKQKGIFSDFQVLFDRKVISESVFTKLV